MNENVFNVPEHVSSSFVNRNIMTGILGFRYETKNEMFIVYTLVEAKTFVSLCV